MKTGETFPPHKTWKKILIFRKENWKFSQSYSPQTWILQNFFPQIWTKITTLHRPILIPKIWLFITVKLNNILGNILTKSWQNKKCWFNLIPGAILVLFNRIQHLKIHENSITKIQSHLSRQINWPHNKSHVFDRFGNFWAKFAKVIFFIWNSFVVGVQAAVLI